jgi:hypothetical protein
LMGEDPLLNNFKQSIIGNKCFILDTDYLLFVITDNGEQSKQYKSLLKQLLGCGCKIYIPKEVLAEVFDHAEASTKRYHFVTQVVGNGGARWAVENINNIFLEAYYRQKEAKSNISWETFIANYYDKDMGISFTIDAIQNTLGDNRNILYGELPNNYNFFESKNVGDIKLKEQMREKALGATLRTSKAETREETKNQRISDTDAMLFLSARQLNIMTEAQNGESTDGRKDLLKHKYYVLTNTFRINKCAEELGIKEHVLCAPSALMAYMVEAGLMNRKDLNILSLFDNPFLSYIADKSWDDATKMVKVGIDFRNKNIVRLRYDLQDKINLLLSLDPHSLQYWKVVDEVKDKGYSFVEQIEHAKELEKQNKEKDVKIEKLETELAHTKVSLGKKRHQDRLQALRNRKGNKRK